MYQVKENEGNYELFKTVEMEDTDGNIVSIPQSIGTYSLEDLTAQREQEQAVIDEIDNKINSINNK